MGTKNDHRTGARRGTWNWLLTAAFGATCLIVGGCGGSSSTCVPGALNCLCGQNDTCAASLVCQNRRCVDANGAAGAGTGGFSTGGTGTGGLGTGLTGTGGFGTGGTGTGGFGTGGSGHTSPSFVAACQASCAEWASCALADLASCNSGCVQLDGIYSAACKDAAWTETDCEATISSCTELNAFWENYRASARCGQAYINYAAACGHSDVPPPQCTSYCAQAEACEPDLITGGCADDCNINIGLYTAVDGAPCTPRVIDLYACYSGMTCSDMYTLLVDQLIPDSCYVQATDFSTYCP